MKIAKIPDLTLSQKDLSEAIAYKNRQSKLQESLKQIIIQRQTSKKEEEEWNKRLDQQTVDHQNMLLYKLERDQKNNMDTKVKNYYSRLDTTQKPNLSVVAKSLDKVHHDYVFKHIKNKQIEEEAIHKMREEVKRNKMREIQEYQRQQMTEKKHLKRASIDYDKQISKEIVSHDLIQQKTFDSIERETKARRINAAKEMLDQQIRMDNLYRQNSIGLDSKEYALNATKIKTVLDKY